MSFIPKTEDLFEEKVALYAEQEKRTHFSITAIGGPEELKAYRAQQKIIKEIERQLSEAKYQVKREIAINMVMGQVSKLEPTAEDLYVDARPYTKFDALVESLRAARKRYFASVNGFSTKKD